MFSYVPLGLWVWKSKGDVKLKAFHQIEVLAVARICLRLDKKSLVFPNTKVLFTEKEF